MIREITIKENRHDNMIYAEFAMISSLFSGEIPPSGKTRYYLDTIHNVLKIKLADLNHDVDITDLDLDNHTFKQKRKTYHFEFIEKE